MSRHRTATTTRNGRIGGIGIHSSCKPNSTSPSFLFDETPFKPLTKPPLNCTADCRLLGVCGNGLHAGSMSRPKRLGIGFKRNWRAGCSLRHNSLIQMMSKAHFQEVGISQSKGLGSDRSSCIGVFHSCALHYLVELD